MKTLEIEGHEKWKRKEAKETKKEKK